MGVSKCSERPVFAFLLKKIGYVPWPDIMLSQTLIHYWQKIFLLILTSDSDAIVIWYHCSFCGLNCQLKCDVTWFCLCFDFVRLYVRYGCCSIVYLCFEVGQIKQVGCKMSTKNVKNVNEKHFVIVLDNCTHENKKPRKIR